MRQTLSKLRPATRRVAVSRAQYEAAPRRTFVSEKELKDRMTAIGKIQKLTSAMGMIATARMKKAQQNMDNATEFAKSMEGLIPTLDEETKEEVVSDAKDGKVALRVLAIAADRGLCGSINSGLYRFMKKQNIVGNKKIDMTSYVVGDRSKAGMERLAPESIIGGMMDCAKKHPLNFKELVKVTAGAQEGDHDSLAVYYNSWKNILTFNPVAVEFPGKDAFLKKFMKKQYGLYEFEGPETANQGWKNFYDFAIAVNVWKIINEALACEIAARMNAMNNSSSAASDQVDALSLEYNKRRQARITTELVEIVSGAEALEN